MFNDGGSLVFRMYSAQNQFAISEPALEHLFFLEYSFYIEYLFTNTD